jgi:hypothetical protein
VNIELGNRKIGDDTMAKKKGKKTKKPKKEKTPK